MALTSGTKLGPYEILAPLGAGGMGEVYRARDTRLGREVALKVLPEAFAADSERMARFRREAQVLASLNHPNIAAIYGLEESGSVHALVMELVEGPTLAERIKQGPIPLDETLPLAKQIAEALEAAHEKGIIHRDLKPANVKITPQGAVKVLDFGLAKALDAEGSASSLADSPTLSPTLNIAATQAGVILGTAAYMSPEQARGKVLDKRTDIWSFGALLFEMLAGRQAFSGETITDVLAAVLTDQPDWSALPPGSPLRLLRRCLEKDPKRRLRDLGDAFDGMEPAGPAPAIILPVWQHPLFWGVLLFALASGGAAGWLWYRAPSAAKTIARLVIPLAPNQELTGPPAISPDGRLVAYTATKGTKEPALYLRDLNAFDANPVDGSEGANQPFFSPDSRWVAFFAHGQLLKAAVGGGSPIKLAVAASPLGGTWNDDDTIIFTPGMGSGLLRVPASGGEVEALTKPRGGAEGNAHFWPQSLPGGRTVLFTIWGKTTAGNAVLSLDTRRWQLVLPGRGGGVFSPPRYLLVSDENAGLRAAPLDPAHPSLTTADIQVLTDVDNYEDLERSWISVSKTDTAVYAPGNPARRSLVWVDREGHIQTISKEQAEYREVRIAPGGSTAVVKQGYDLWTYDFQQGTRTRLTFHENTQEDASSPVWSRDGTRVIFASNGEGNWDIYSQPADGSRPPEVLLKRPYDKFPVSATRDGTVLFNEANPTTGEDLWALAPDGRASPYRVTPFNESNGDISPDGRWIAYDSDESGRSEVYIQAYPGGGKRFVISSGGGYMPRWSDEGKEVFYFSGDALMVATVSSDGSVAGVRRLFDRSGFLVRYTSYDVSPDGRRLLMIHRDPGSVPSQLNVVLNWSEELQRLVTPGRK